MRETTTVETMRKMVNTAGGFGLWSVETDARNVARFTDGDDADMFLLANAMLDEIARLREAFFVDGTTKAVRLAFTTCPPEIVTAIRARIANHH